MYSNKENINILTALLKAYGVTHAVVCPGSRNAPIVHNLNETSGIECHPVTDERSAGFYALGMSLAVDGPVAVCVTSGTALLNLAPAVAEAFYQHVPLVVISADRPAQWIDQLDGQTLPQPTALGPFVKKAVSLPEPHDDEERWYCQRLIQEALLCYGGPVHINVPISEPLFEFTVAELPVVRKITSFNAGDSPELINDTVLGAFFKARRPMVVIGQDSGIAAYIGHLRCYAVVLHESLYAGNQEPVLFDEVLRKVGDDAAYKPDCVMYIGGTLVSKRLKKFLRASGDATFIRVSDDGHLDDTFQHLDYLVETIPYLLLRKMNGYCKRGAFRNEDLEKDEPLADTKDFVALWHKALRRADEHARAYTPDYSQMLAVKCFEKVLTDKMPDAIVHYANSTAIRLANIYAHHPVWCCRGVNGIEGSLSTAAGFAAQADTSLRVFCVIGDLSFFYDANALWNTRLHGNLRILLLNNGGGGVFRMLPGLEKSPARGQYVAAEHQASAEGICLQNNIVYLKAENQEQLKEGVERLVSEESDRPMLLEVLTEAAIDARVLKDYYQY